MHLCAFYEIIFDRPFRKKWYDDYLGLIYITYLAQVLGINVGGGFFLGDTGRLHSRDSFDMICNEIGNKRKTAPSIPRMDAMFMFSKLFYEKMKIINHIKNEAPSDILEVKWLGLICHIYYYATIDYNPVIKANRSKIHNKIDEVFPNQFNETYFDEAFNICIDLDTLWS